MGKAIFLEGLQAARELVTNKGLKALDDLIKEHEEGMFEAETAAIEHIRETRGAWE
jgi:hypothetical protein